MENKCKCYHTQPKTRYTYNQFTGRPIPHDIEVGVCWGTKETDECSCGGDETKCDFYPEVREKAKNKKREDSLVITYDNCPPDVPTLIVARKDKYDMTILNKIQGDEAFGIYHYLTGGAGLKIARKPIKIGKYGFGCPNCKDDLGLEEEDIYIYDMTPPKYCSNCGQRLDWK